MLQHARVLRNRLDLFRKLSAAVGWRRVGYLVASGYLSLVEGALLGALLAIGIVGFGLLVQRALNLLGIIWVSALAPSSMVYLALVWAFMGALLSAALDLLHPPSGTAEHKALPFIYLVYSSIFLFYAWLGPAGMSRVGALAFYLVVLIAISLLAVRHKGLPWALVVPYLVMPPALTILLGLHSYSQLIEAVPREGGAPARQGALLFMHLSDTHFVGREEGLTFQGATWSTQNMEATARLVRRLQPPLLLVSGDVTDTGARREWEQAMNRLLRPAKEAGSRVILAPGTHDMHPAFSGADDADSDFVGLVFQIVSHLRTVRELAQIEWSWLDRFFLSSVGRYRFVSAVVPVPSFVSRAVLARRFLEYQEELAAGVTADGSIVSERLKQAFDMASWVKEAQASDRLKSQLILDRCFNPQAESSAALQNACDALREALGKYSAALGTGVGCDDLYPLLYPDERTHASVIVLCDAAVTTRGFGSAALGLINKEQLARFAQMLARVSQDSRYVIIMLHHRPIRPRDDRWGFPKTWHAADWANSPLYHYSFLRGDAETANALVTTILEQAGRHPDRTYVLLYGHAHQKFLGKVYGREGQGQLWISETSALYEELGARVAYAGSDGTDLVWDWVKP
jgi:3',5'-cyclic AMP phosphodiesterase CpdA